MATNILALSVFIASPGDVSAERQIAEQVVGQVDHTFREMFETTLDVLKWEKQPPLTQPMNKESLQEEINEKVKVCDIFLLILYKRIGSREGEFDKSNTEREIDIILERINRNERVMLLTYFRELKDNEDQGKQEREVRELRATLEQNRIWYAKYTDNDSFERKLTHHIYQTTLKFMWETTKQKATRHFWQLGDAERPASTKLAIIYPPIDRSYTEMEEPDIYWCNRLAPHIVFEDHKALQKIQKSLGITGLRNYRIYTTSSIPKDVRYMNRVWLCLPRNRQAQRQLMVYQKEKLCRFEIVPSTRRRYGGIKWSTSQSSGEYFHVKSPLNSYLRLQRAEMMGGEWKAEMEHIVAKDYAIFARFRDTLEDVDTRSGYLHDYFFAGIRGLGTWGAAWFLDRRAKILLRYKRFSDIQLLLEVTYLDGRIFQVSDVSEKPPSYFQTQMLLSTIKRIIAEHY